ncbi:hypothetical protein KIN20_001624 [Parelaphostrongylus tenuis]|uniref:C2H2-type domain-containing protein n=1 Tax=Parelaphostrongylus tenuis TaxID=148309 RepID=A0AAD5LTY3_PARTN|nr:hypothetical protein KIN20_001624 [Parelaphostrongylus tenuis]
MIAVGSRPDVPDFDHIVASCGFCIMSYSPVEEEHAVNKKLEMSPNNLSSASFWPSGCDARRGERRVDERNPEKERCLRIFCCRLDVDAQASRLRGSFSLRECSPWKIVDGLAQRRNAAMLMDFIPSTPTTSIGAPNLHDSLANVPNYFQSPLPGYPISGADWYCSRMRDDPLSSLPNVTSLMYPTLGQVPQSFVSASHNQQDIGIPQNYDLLGRPNDEELLRLGITRPIPIMPTPPVTAVNNPFLIDSLIGSALTTAAHETPSGGGNDPGSGAETSGARKRTYLAEPAQCISKGQPTSRGSVSIGACEDVFTGNDLSTNSVVAPCAADHAEKDTTMAYTVLETVASKRRKEESELNYQVLPATVSSARVSDNQTAPLPYGLEGNGDQLEETLAFSNREPSDYFAGRHLNSVHVEPMQCLPEDQLTPPGSENIGAYEDVFTGTILPSQDSDGKNNSTDVDDLEENVTVMGILPEAAELERRDVEPNLSSGFLIPTVNSNRVSHNCAAPLSCGLEGCSQWFSCRKELCIHLRDDHFLPVSIIRVTFSIRAMYPAFLDDLASERTTYRTDEHDGRRTVYSCRWLLSSRDTTPLRLLDAAEGELLSCYAKNCANYSAVPTRRGPFVRQGGVCPAFVVVKHSRNSYKVTVCDWHLHGPVLPTRALEMMAIMLLHKRLPTPVVRMVILGQTNQFCTPTSAVDLCLRRLDHKQFECICEFVRKRYSDNVAIFEKIGNYELTPFERICIIAHQNSMEFTKKEDTRGDDDAVKMGSDHGRAHT